MNEKIKNLLAFSLVNSPHGERFFGKISKSYYASFLDSNRALVDEGIGIFLMLRKNHALSGDGGRSFGFQIEGSQSTYWMDIESASSLLGGLDDGGAFTPEGNLISEVEVAARAFLATSFAVVEDARKIFGSDYVDTSIGQFKEFSNDLKELASQLIKKEGFLKLVK
jgi:hypothetical protein